MVFRRDRGVGFFSRLAARLPLLGGIQGAAYPFPTGGVLSNAQAQLVDLAGLTLSGDFTADTPGQIDISGATGQSTVTTDDTFVLSPDVWVLFTMTDRVAGQVTPAVLAPFANFPLSTGFNAQHVARRSSNSSTRFRLTANAGSTLSIKNFQAYPMAQTLAQVTRVWIAAGQSLIACETSSRQLDPRLDTWPSKRALYTPGVSNLGDTIGDPCALVAPLQMAVPSTGVSPAISFAQRMLAELPPDENILIVAAARGGTGLVDSDDPWNSRGSSPTSYQNMITLANNILANLPANSTFEGVLWGQGESDRRPTIEADYAAPFSNLVDDARTDLGVPDLPFVLLGPNPDDPEPNQLGFITAQERLDQDSGHATAKPGVFYVARPSGFIDPQDATHPTAEGQRAAGLKAANEYLQRISSPSQQNTFDSNAWTWDDNSITWDRVA